MIRARPPLPPGFLARPFAHRGLHDMASEAGPGRPENSLAAIAAAAAAGFGIEIDLQPSADGHAMVFHDATLDRMTDGRGPVRRRNAAELEQLQLSGTAERVPRLTEVLDLVAGRVPLLLEVKDQHGALGPVDGRLEAALARALRGYDGPAAAMSFNPHSVLALRRMAPEFPRGRVTCAFAARDWPQIRAARRARLSGIADLARLGAAFVSHDIRDLPDPRVDELRASGCAVLCWTVRDAAMAAKAMAVADAITFEGFRPGHLDPARPSAT